MPTPLHETGVPLARALALTRTLIGKKALMAVTGLALFGFVVAHMLGNLKVFQGPEHFNAYAEGLRTLGAPFFRRSELLWFLRIILLVSVIVHIWAAYETTRASWSARPERYRHKLEAVESTYAARTMRWGGVLVLVYVVYHLLDLTFGAANPGFVPHDVYRNLVASFQRVPVAGFYMVANVAVGLHIYHGLWSALQTLGLNRAPTDRWRRSIAAVIAGALTLGYLVVPIAVLGGWVGTR